MQCKRFSKISRAALALVFLLTSYAHAAPQTHSDPNFLRTHFTTDDGLPAPVVNQTTQTNDGFLWLVVNSNLLVRFDGKNFFLFSEPRPKTLAAAPDGALWLGTNDGLIHIPADSLNQFTLSGLITYHPGAGKANTVNCLRFSHTGALWVGTDDGLFRFEHDQFTPFGPRVSTRQVDEAPDGHLLLITEQGFTEFAGDEVVPHPKVANEILHVLKDSQGNIWYCTPLGIERETNGRIEQFGPTTRAVVAYEDIQGRIWIGTDRGLFRATPAGLESVADDIQARALYNDRDGNLWVSTNGDGFYRIKDRAARTYTSADGLPNNVLMTVIATQDGSVWTGANCGGISRFDGTHFRTYNEKDGLVNSCVFALAEDANRDLWIGTWGGGAFHFHDGKFTQYSISQGLPNDVVLTILVARDGAIWFGTHGGLTRLKDGALRNFTSADGLSSNSIIRVFENKAGVIWAGTPKGLDRLAGERFEHFTSLPNTPIIPFGEDRDGGFYADVEIESAPILHRLDQSRLTPIKEFTATDLLETERGELWFGGTPITRVPPGALKYERPRDEPLDYESFSADDGLATAFVTGVGRSLALTNDDKLWAATPEGLAMFDLRRLEIANAKPSIYLTDVTIGRNTQHAGREIVLAPGTNHVEIFFAAVEITAPEKIRFQYRLDGVDSEWLDAPANPHAIYSNIPVGTHALHIRACNRNGVWDRQGVVFNITQRPYFYQTRWFIVAIVALGLLLIGLTYRLRVAQISRQISARFDERLAERTRVARELHDTLLQTVHGSKLVAEHALKNSADHTRMVRAMEQLVTWLAQATDEGRAALQSLRASATAKNDLSEALRQAIDECGKKSNAEFVFSVNGNSREIHPVVRDEIYRIGYEALHNACTHSSADRLEITLEYSHDVTLRVGDNGIGIDPAVVEHGKEGHFGLHGMRERAERINAKFTLVSAENSGTVITLIVPGRIAFIG